jgi:hypothetical protein
MPIFIQQYILGFNIPINNTLVMHIFDGHYSLNKIEFSILFCHISMIFHKAEKLAGRTVIQDEDVELFCFDKTMHFYQ